MQLTEDEIEFLTALAREQDQSGCRGPAHDLLRNHVYANAPICGPGSLAFAYEAVPLTGLLVKELTDLDELDGFLRQGKKVTNPVWPWSSAEQYRLRLEEARREWQALRENRHVATST